MLTVIHDHGALCENRITKTEMPRNIIYANVMPNVTTYIPFELETVVFISSPTSMFSFDSLFSSKMDSSMAYLAFNFIIFSSRYVSIGGDTTRFTVVARLM